MTGSRRFLHCVAVAFAGLSLRANGAHGESFGIDPFADRVFSPAPLAASWEQVQEGRELFLRNWLKSGVPNGTNGDGLGPMFNAASCVECHFSGGAGGAGGESHNVDLLSLIAPEGLFSSFQPPPFRVQQQAMDLHPGFVVGSGEATRLQPNVILHKFAIQKSLAVGGPQLSASEIYDGWRSAFLREGKVDALSPERPVRHSGNLKTRLSQRNTPALFGAGLIDAVPDHLILSIAQEQRDQRRDTAGRVPRDAAGRVGRFGWRGQIDHLHEFVLGACANELGLQVTNHSQPSEVVPGHPERKRWHAYLKRSSDKSFDLSDEQCLALSAFVGALLPPTRTDMNTAEQARNVASGESLFVEIGCAQCHRKDVGPISGIYSDLLLHDMGPELADPVGALPETVSSAAVESVGYFGGAAPAPRIAKAKGRGPNLQQEWRTPPLWGVRDSAPYLHDGRASTLDEAIRSHRGQGRRAARQYAALRTLDRSHLLAFLGSLSAPSAAPGRRSVLQTPPNTGVLSVSDPFRTPQSSNGADQRFRFVGHLLR